MKNEFKRVCPQCGNDIFYANKYNLKYSSAANTLCSRCCVSGENNGFFGKRHSKKTIKKFQNKDTSYTQTQEFREMSSKRAKKVFENPEIRAKLNINNRGLSKQKINQWKKKLSKANSGSNNAMYGKPSPQGSGNGWSGWYNGFYFRSLLELSYLKYLFDNDVKFRTAETQEFKVEYKDWEGNKRNYFPDFYLEDTKEIVEIKPKKLVNSKQNKSKFKAAKKKYGNKFKIITEEIKISDDEIKILYENHEVKFLERYENKLKEKYL